MQGKDFSGQNLRGRSFRNQDLTGADFSNCDLRGVKFTGANLTSAKFCHARMGKTLKTIFGVSLLQFLLGVFSGFIAAISNIFLLLYAAEFLKTFDLNLYNNQVIFVITYSFLFSVTTLIAIKCKRLKYIGWFFALIITITAKIGAMSIIIVGFGVIAVIIAGVGARTKAVIRAMTDAIAVIGAIAGTVAIAVVGAIVTAITVAGAGVLAGVGAIVGIVIVNITIPETMVFDISSAIYIMLGIYLGNHAINKEEVQLLLLRDLFLKFNSLGGTKFARTNLKDVDFSYADLKYTRFQGAWNILNCHFQNCKNHHLAVTTNTSLSLKKVRDLIILGKNNDNNFSELQLQGLDFSGVKNLQGFNFANANLSFANFENCDLKNADLSEINALGTCFNETKMTGACIKNWNIDTRTQLQNIDCDYVYLAENQQQRNPPEGEFEKNEFSKLYQQIADTVDFIAHSRDELDALLAAVNVIKAQDGCDEIFVQNIERKEDSVVVKVKTPEGFDREQIYKEVKKEQKKKIKQIKAQHKQKLLEKEGEIEQLKDKQDMLSQNNDLLASLLKDSVQRPISVTSQSESSVMKEDNSRTFTGNNNNNINLGDNSTLTNSIQQLSDSDNNLKELLTKLGGVIEQSPLADEDKQDALQEAQTIAEAKKEEPEKQKSIIAKALRTLKRFGGDLQDAPDVLEQYSEIIEQIGEVF